MNTKQRAAEEGNFPSFLSELSEQESAGGQMFSLTEGGRMGGGGGLEVPRDKLQPTQQPRRNKSIKSGREMMWPGRDYRICLH